MKIILSGWNNPLSKAQNKAYALLKSNLSPQRRVKWDLSSIQFLGWPSAKGWISPSVGCYSGMNRWAVPYSHWIGVFVTTPLQIGTNWYTSWCAHQRDWGFNLMEQEDTEPPPIPGYVKVVICALWLNRELQSSMLSVQSLVIPYCFLKWSSLWLLYTSLYPTRLK